MSPVIRFVTLEVGGGYGSEARTYSDPPTVSSSGDVAWFPSGRLRWCLSKAGLLTDWERDGRRVSVREVTPEGAASIAAVDAEIEVVTAQLAMLRLARVEVCEAAAARGRKVKVPLRAALGREVLP